MRKTLWGGLASLAGAACLVYLAGAHSVPSLLNEPISLSSGLSFEAGGGEDSADVADLRRRAEQGEINAQMRLAALYEQGSPSLERDIGQAKRWYETAAEAGSGDAAYALGVLYQEIGEPVAAFKWLDRALTMGKADAGSIAGAVLLHGDGVEQSFPEAARWFRRGASQGSASSQYCLGRMHESGLGVPEDLQQALFWCRLADEQGHSQAGRALARIRPRLSPEQTSSVERQLRRWREGQSKQ